jgi:hypothetical protein
VSLPIPARPARSPGRTDGAGSDGRIETIEGNFENKVSTNIRGAGEATSYVSMS